MRRSEVGSQKTQVELGVAPHRACARLASHAMTPDGALGVHCPGGAAKDAEGISLAALAELLERSRPKTGRIGGAEDGRGRGGSNMGTGAGLGAAAAFFAAAEVAVDVAVAASGPQKN